MQRVGIVDVGGESNRGGDRGVGGDGDGEARDLREPDRESQHYRTLYGGVFLRNGNESQPISIRRGYKSYKSHCGAEFRARFALRVLACAARSARADRSAKSGSTDGA